MRLRTHPARPLTYTCLCGDSWSADSPDVELWCAAVAEHYTAHARANPNPAALAASEALCGSYRRLLILGAIEAGTLVRDDLTPLTHQEVDVLRFAVLGETP